MECSTAWKQSIWRRYTMDIVLKWGERHGVAIQQLQSGPLRSQPSSGWTRASRHRLNMGSPYTLYLPEHLWWWPRNADGDTQESPAPWSRKTADQTWPCSRWGSWLVFSNLAFCKQLLLSRNFRGEKKRRWCKEQWLLQFCALQDWT